jgi:hypothetical protein
MTMTRKTTQRSSVMKRIAPAGAIGGFVIVILSEAKDLSSR